MSLRRPSLMPFLWLSGLALLGGCQSIQPPAMVAQPVEAPVLSPSLPLPAAMHEFTLADTDGVIGEVQIVRARDEDTLSDIARRFNVGYEELVTANPDVDPWFPKEGTEVVLPTRFVLPDARRQGIVINLAAMRLFYFPQAKPGEPQRVITHPVGIGRVGWRTPEGKTRIVAKAANPAWIPTAAIRKEHAADGNPLPKVVPPGPDNPLGTHVLRLGWPEYAIHGTDKPPSIGLRGTHGCLRLYPEDVIRIYEAVPVGTPVTVVNQPVLLGWQGDTLVMQAYPALEDDKRNHRRLTERLLKRVEKSVPGGPGSRATPVVDQALAAEIMGKPRAIAMPVSGSGTSLQAFLATALRVENTLPADATWAGEASPRVAIADEPSETRAR